jgi:predicted MPP superfamily phosphohydrolase
MNRRTFLKRTAAAAVGGSAGTLAYAMLLEPHWLQIVHRDLPIAGLPLAVEGRTLAQITDVHVGPKVSDDYLKHSFDRVARLAPDIVVFTGDFISYVAERGEAQFKQLAGVLAHFPRGRVATLGVLGNHDYGQRWREPEVAQRVVQVAEQAGIRILRNDTAAVEGLDIVGVDDLWAGRADPRAALAKRTGGASLALCHNPDAMDKLDWGDYRGWVLAGHTHGGQCKAPFLPPPLLPVENKRYVAGAVDAGGGRTLYISRGVGHLLQARFNVRPEVALFTLRRQS